MPDEENPRRGAAPDRAPPHGADSTTINSEHEERSCRICGEIIKDPFPNQYDCLECEDREQREGLDRPNTSNVESDGSKTDVDIVPKGNQDINTGQSDLQADLEQSDLPPIRTKPEDKTRILQRIDGAGNEDKFRALHLEGEWQQYYNKKEYDDPYETAVVGYLRILAFYTRLSVLHMEGFYRASALYDPDFWQSWQRLNALEAAIEAQANSDPNWRMYGYSDTVEERLNRARSRLSLIERRMER